MFQIQAFNPQAAAATQIVGAFSNIVIAQYDTLSNDGDGNLIVTVGGQQLKKARSLHIALGGFSGASFTQTRRQFWLKKWSKGAADEAGAPDCYSEDGLVPHESAPHKQAGDCKSCARSQKNEEGYVPCGYSKDLLVYLIEADPSGSAKLVLDTPLIWRASAMSLFGQYDQASASAGLIAMAAMLQKSGVRVFEQVVFELGFHQSSKAPSLKAVGMMPVTEAEKVILAAAQPDVKAKLEFKAPVKAAALPAPPKAAPAPAPVAAPALSFAAPAPVAPPPVAHVPMTPANLVPAATPAVIEAAQAPVVLPVAAPAAAPVTAASLQAEVMTAMAAGQPVDPAKLAQLQALLMAQTQAAAAPAPAPVAPPVAAPAPSAPPAIPGAPVAQAAPASAQAAALAAFRLGTAR